MFGNKVLRRMSGSKERKEQYYEENYRMKFMIFTLHPLY
jgi:hypothetical protein